jgi:hypothetical protein
VAWVAGRIGVLLVAGGAIALVASLWLPWFAEPRVCIEIVGVPCPPVLNHTAWEAFRVADVLLVAFAVIAIAGAVAEPPIATRLAPRLGLEPALGGRLAWLAVAAAGWLAICVSIYAVNRPNLPVSPGRVTDAGYFVALLAGGAIVGGAWWEQRTS